MPVTFTARVRSAAGRTVTTGLVSFRLDGVASGIGALNAAGLAVFISPQLGQGYHAIEAFFGGTPVLDESETAISEIDATALAPIFSPPGGTYTGPRAVTITDYTPGAVIHCTVNGAIPTIYSPVYTAPVTFTSSAAIRAVAIAPNYALSPVGSAS